MTDKMIQKAVSEIRKHGDFTAKIALVLGSGLGNFVETLSNTTRISFSDIPGFPVSTVEGHSGEMVHGYLNGIPVLVNSGRVHFYEGYSLDEVVYPVRILHALGAETIFITNAAGSIQKAFPPGDLMLITKLMNLTGHSVSSDESESPDIFNASSLEHALTTAKNISIPLKTGTYAGLNGPSYETPAEIRFLRIKKADAVGMSTVHESMAAHLLGMDVIGISCLTNYAAGILDQPLNHEEVIETGLRVQNDFAKLLSELIASIT